MTPRLLSAAWPALILAGAAAAAAEPSFSLSGSVRVRQEYLDGQYRPGYDETDRQFGIRSSLRAEWRRSGWRLVGEVYDSRAYGVDEGSVVSASEVNVLEPVQAYVQRDFDAPLGEGSSASLQAGRFTLNIGSRRLVASDDYRNTAQGYTGLRADLRTVAKTTATAFLVMPQQRRPEDLDAVLDHDWKLDREGRELVLWGATVARPGLLPDGALGEASYVGLREKDRAGRPTRDRRLHTLGLRALRKPARNRIDYEFEAIYQSGRARASTAPDAARLDVSAWFLHAEAGYTFDHAWRPHAVVEFDHASGDGPGPQYHRFDTLFGMRRADLAPSGIFGAVGRANLQALGVRVEVEPHPRLDAFLAWRVLDAAAAADAFATSGIRDASGASGSRAGYLLDSRLRWWVVPKSLRAEVNAVWLKRGRLLREAPNASPWGDTHYIAAALTYSF